MIIDTLLIISILVNLIMWFEYIKKTTPVVHIVSNDVSPKLMDKTEEVIDIVNKKYDGNNGENKRHHALALLMKEFPDTPQWKIGLAIESAIAKTK